MRENSLTIRIPRSITIKTLYSVIIALLPVIAHFMVPFWGSGFATLMIGVTVPYPIMCILRRKKFRDTLPVFLLIAYLLFRSTSSLRGAFLLFMVLCHSIGAFNDSLDFSIVKKTIVYVCLFSSAAVLLQSALYYLFHIRSSLLIRAFLLDDNKYYVNMLTSGTGLYRPAAFFLEPSHYAQYASIGLGILLFGEKKQSGTFKRAFWTTLGIILTTSGMGIAICIGMWGWYVVFNQYRKGTRIVYVVFGLLLLVAVCALLYLIPFVRSAVSRVVVGDKYGHTAIWGRTLYWNSTVGKMSLSQKIIGYGRRTRPDVYMTSLMSTIYQDGYIGVCLYALVVFRCMFRGRNNLSFSTCLVYVALFCFAGMTGFIRLVFWLCLMELEASDAVRLRNEVISDES